MTDPALWLLTDRERSNPSSGVRAFTTVSLFSLLEGLLEVEYEGFPSIKKGDRVLVTGVLMNNTGMFRPPAIKAGTMEKLKP